jgi:hypothetical protein
MEQWQDYVFLLAGLTLVAWVLVRPPRWEPVNVQRGDLVLKVPAAAFLVVAGLAMASVGVFFRYRNYEGMISSEVEATRAALQKAEATKLMVEDLHGEIERLRAHDVYVDLQFLETLPPGEITFQGLVSPPGELGAPQVRPADIIERRAGNKVVTVRLAGLHKGDRVAFGAIMGGLRWKSPMFDVPGKASVSMEKEPVQ